MLLASLLAGSTAFSGQKAASSCPIAFGDESLPDARSSSRTSSNAQPSTEGLSSQNALGIVSVALLGAVPPTHPYSEIVRSRLQVAQAHSRKFVEDLRGVVRRGEPVPEELTQRMLGHRLEFLGSIWGIDATDQINRHIMLQSESILLMAMSPSSLIELKVSGQFVEAPTRNGRLAPATGPSHFGPFKREISDLYLAEQNVSDLIRSTREYRNQALERNRQHIKEGDVIGWHFVDQTGFPTELSALRSITFTAKTLQHSFPHFSQGLDPSKQSSDLLLLSRRTMTTVVSTRLSLQDIVLYLNLLDVKEGQLPLTLDTEGLKKNAENGRGMAPFRLKIPTSADGHTEPLEFGVIVCAQQECLAKGVSFRLGEVISVFPVSGPGVIRIPPRNELHRLLRDGATVERILNP